MLPNGLDLRSSHADQLEFVFSPAPRPSKFRQTEFPWRYRNYRRRPNFEEFKRLRHLLGQGKFARPREHEFGTH